VNVFKQEALETV